MLGKSYTVKQGDTLWDLSATHLDDPMRWPEIFLHNNQPEVITKTGLRIADPDLIFVNQNIYIPEARVTAQAIPGKSGKVRAKTKFRSVPFKYEFDAIPVIVVTSPTHVAVVSLVGSVTIQSEKAYDILAIKKNGFTAGAKASADTIFGQLIADVKVGWNEGQKKVKFEIGLTLKSNTPYAPEISVSAGTSSIIPGLPVMKVSMKTPAMNQPRGKIAGHFYTTNDFGVEMEIFPKQGSSVRRFVGEHVAMSSEIQPATPNPAMPSTIQPATPNPSSRNSNWWSELSPSVLKTAAYILIAATIVEDIATMGAGIADDVATFTLAAAMLRLAASRPVVNAAVRTGTRIMVAGGRTAAVAVGASVTAAAPAYAK